MHEKTHPKLNQTKSVEQQSNSPSIQRLRKIYCVLYMLITPSIEDVGSFESNNEE